MCMCFIYTYTHTHVRARTHTHINSKLKLYGNTKLNSSQLCHSSACYCHEATERTHMADAASDSFSPNVVSPWSSLSPVGHQPSYHCQYSCDSKGYMLKGKGEVLSHSMPWWHRQRCTEVYLHSILNSHAGHFTPGKRPQYPLNRMLGVPQSWSGHFGEEKHLLPLPQIKPRFLCHPAHNLVTILTMVSWLQPKKSCISIYWNSQNTQEALLTRYQQFINDGLNMEAWDIGPLDLGSNTPIFATN